MNALSVVRDLSGLSKSQIHNAIGLTKCTKGLGYVAGGLLAAASIMNLSYYANAKEDKNSSSLLAAGCAALASVIAFKSAGSIGKFQRMLKIAEKFSTVA